MDMVRILGVSITQVRTLAKILGVYHPASGYEWMEKDIQEAKKVMTEHGNYR